jgi:amino acid transporter
LGDVLGDSSAPDDASLAPDPHRSADHHVTRAGVVREGGVVATEEGGIAIPPTAGDGAPRTLSVRQAAFIGVGAMVGAGIFALLGAAGEVAGAAVWLSFLLAGIVAGLQGYSFAKLGARYPSAGGFLEYVVRCYGNGRVTGVVSWLVFATNAIITGMVAVSFGSYASAAVADDSEAWMKVFAVLVVLAMTGLNVLGSQAVANAQTVVVVVVIGILTIFAVSTLANVDWGLLAFSGYPSVADIVSSVALTFFAFLGFGIITFTAKDLPHPGRQLPRAVFLALGIATVIYVAVALGVFGTLTVDKVIDSGGTALAVAAEPTLGRAGYWMMSVTALFATAGATNAGLYPAGGLGEQMASIGQFPPLLGRRLHGRVPVALVLTAAGSIVLALFFDLSAIASIGSAVALVVFTLISAGHLRIRRHTGALTWVLLLAVASTSVVLISFALTTLVDEPGTTVAIVVILLLSILLDVGWKRSRARQEQGAEVSPGADDARGRA